MTREQLIETLIGIDMERIMNPNDPADARFVLGGILRNGWIGYQHMLTPQLREMLIELTGAA